MMCNFTLPEVFCTSQSHHHFRLNALWLSALWINTHMDNDVILLYPRCFAQRHKVITTFVWMLCDCLHCGLTLTWAMMCDFTLPEVFCTSQNHHHFSLNALWLSALWINAHMDNDVWFYSTRGVLHDVTKSSPLSSECFMTVCTED